VLNCSDLPSGEAEENEQQKVAAAEEKAALPWYEARFHVCLICEEEVPLGSFSLHVREQHQITFSRYRYLQSATGVYILIESSSPPPLSNKKLFCPSSVTPIVKSSVSDPHPFCADPDPT
jgi:hypothetical protein